MCFVSRKTVRKKSFMDGTVDATEVFILKTLVANYNRQLVWVVVRDRVSSHQTYLIWNSDWNLVLCGEATRMFTSSIESD